jgi:hypothetical protein
MLEPRVIEVTRVIAGVWEHAAGPAVVRSGSRSWPHARLLLALAAIGCANDPAEPAQVVVILTDAGSRPAQPAAPADAGSAAPRAGNSASAADADAPLDDADAGSPGDAGPELDAGREPPPTPPEPTCEGDEWRLAPGLLLARRVEYVADRLVTLTEDGTLAVRVVSENGTPCATAHDRASCEAALHTPAPFGRHILTTAGDAIKFWSGDGVLSLFGVIDTPAEAVWWLIQTRGVVPCSAEVSAAGDGYRIAKTRGGRCGPLPDGGWPMDSVMFVQPDGTVLEESPEAGTMQCPNPLF